MLKIYIFKKKPGKLVYCVDSYTEIYFHASVRKIFGNIGVQYSFPFLCLCSFSFTNNCHLLMALILWNLLHLFPLSSRQIAEILGVSHMATSPSLKVLLFYLLPDMTI